MDPSKFIENFELIASAPGGVQRLRQLIIQLAVQGKLVPQQEGENNAAILLKEIDREREQLIRGGIISRQKPLAEPEEHEKTFPLPPAWVWTRLGRLVTLEYGEGLPEKRRNNQGTISVYGSNGVVGRHDKSLIDKPAIIVGRKGSSGALNIARTPCWPTDVTYYVIPPKAIDLDFCFILLKSLDLENLGKGIKPGLNRNEAYLLAAALPPFKEQKLIVTKVDQLMAFCDQLESHQFQLTQTHQNANKRALEVLRTALNDTDIQAAWARLFANFDSFFTNDKNLSELKETLFDLAVQGKIVRQNIGDQSAEELLGAIAKERKNHGGNLARSKPIEQDSLVEDELSAGWAACRANELALFITSGSRGWAQHYSDKGALFIRIGNLSYEKTSIDMSNIQFVCPPEGAEGKRTHLEPQDILISITGDTGMVGVVPPNFPEAYINQHICLFRPSRLIDHEYLALMFRSKRGLRQLRKLQKGIKNSLSLQDIRDVIVNLPPREEQRRIVEQVNRLMTLYEKLKKDIATLLKVHENLATVLIHDVLTKDRELTVVIQKEGKQMPLRKIIVSNIKLKETDNRRLVNSRLAKLLLNNEAGLNAKDLWEKSNISSIDEFYATLRNEIEDDLLADPEVAKLKLVEVVE